MPASSMTRTSFFPGGASIVFVSVAVIASILGIRYDSGIWFDYLMNLAQEQQSSKRGIKQ
jgi:hypothetical protein